MGELTLGMDLAASASGLVVVRRDAARGFKAVAQRTAKRKGPASSQAMCEMAEEIIGWARSFEGLELAALEDVFAPPAKKREDETFAQAQKRAASQRQHALDNARLGGIVEYLFWRRGHPTMRLHPAAWRARALGRSERSTGQWSKLDIPLALFKRYAFEGTDEHQAMAFGIAVAALILTGGHDDDGRTSRPARWPAPPPTLPGVV